MRYLGLRNKLIHPLPLSVFFKNLFVLHSVFYSRKYFFSKKIFFNSLSSLSGLRFNSTPKHKNLKKMLLFSTLNIFLRRKILYGLKKKHVRLSSKQFEFSKRKAGFILSSNFRLFSFA